MADKRVTVTIEAVDKASSTIKSIGSQLSSLGKLGDIKGLSNLGNTVNNIGKAFSGIKGKAGIAATGITMAVNGFNKLYTASKQSFIDGLSKIGNVCKTIVSGIVGAGKAFLSFAGGVANADLSFAGLAKTSMNYDQAIERIGVKAGATDGEMTKLGDTIKKLTVDTVYSMDEVAEAAEYMVQNGRTATQVVDELGAVTGLATVGNLSLSRSADIVASTMNMFSRQGISAKQVANLFAQAANTSGADVENFAKTLENCGPQAAALNIPFEQLMATLATMGDNAIKGGKAGTTMKNFLQRMAAPTKEASDAIKQYGLESAQAKIASGDLKGGLLEMKKALDLNKISSTAQQKAVKQLAGSYGSAGLTSVLNTATDELMVTFDAMEKGLVSTGDLEKGMEKLMGTIQGQVMRFSANVQLAFYNLYTKAGSSIAKVMEVFNNFLSMLNDGAGLESALKYLEMESNKIPQILSNAISNGIKAIDNFINGGAFDSILNIGTNIIKGITSGIDKAYNSGALTSAITGMISKICDFITTNAPLIQKAGKQIIDAVMQGIENNKDKIRTAMDSLCGIIETWVSGSAQLESAMGQFADIMMESFITQVGIKAQAKAGELWDAIASMLTPDKMPDFSKGGTGILQWIVGSIDWSIDKVNEGGQKTGESYTDGVQKGVDGKPLKLNESNFTELYNQYGNHGLTGGQNFGTKASEGIESTKAEIISKGSEVGTGTAQAIEESLNSMNTDQLKELKTAIDEVGEVTKSTASSMKTSFTGITNSARTSFIGLTNIVRNQMTNVSNIVRDRVQNARNAFTQQFISMASVARTQMVNVSNIVRNQAMRWSGIIRSQASNARNALTSSFMSMAAVARNQMANVLSVVRSYMSQIAATCNRTLTLKVNISKTETTTKKVVVEKSGLGLTMPQSSSLSASGYTRSTSSIGLGTLVGALSSASTGSNRAISIEVPLVLEGREIARASAIYTREELARLEKRNNRKRGE